MKYGGAWRRVSRPICTAVLSSCRMAARLMGSFSRVRWRKVGTETFPTSGIGAPISQACARASGRRSVSGDRVTDRAVCLFFRQVASIRARDPAAPIILELAQEVVWKLSWHAVCAGLRGTFDGQGGLDETAGFFEIRAGSGGCLVGA